jgi:hypothetical protein
MGIQAKTIRYKMGDTELPKVRKRMGAPKGSNKGHAPYPGCETGGRPKVQDVAFIENEAEELIKWCENSGNLYFKTFALKRGYHPQRLSEWAKTNIKFAEALSLATAWQESKLVDGGLTSSFNSGFTKFVLINKHDWKDKAEEQQVTNNTYNVNYGRDSE